MPILSLAITVNWFGRLTGIIESVTATDLTNGAGDIIKAGDGDNIIVGATGNDDIEVGIDNDTILGDGGVALYNAGVLS